MFCSSGSSRLPNGSPYWIPTSRSAAASARMAARNGSDLRTRIRTTFGLRGARGGGTALSTSRNVLDGGRHAADEVGDVRRLDEHRVDAGPFERDHVVAGRCAEICDRELAGRDIGQQVEDPVEVVLVVLGVARREQEDLGIDPLERRLDRLVVVHVGDDLQAERAGPRVQLLQVFLVGVLLDDGQAGTGSCLVRGLGRRVDPEQDRQLARPDSRCRSTQSETLGALLLGCLCGRGVADERDDRDPVSLGDRLAEAPRPGHCADANPAGQVPIGCQTVLSSRKAAISHGLCAVGSARTTRLTFSAASFSRSGASPSAPVTSIALTSMCPASQGASSSRWPVRMLTTPLGTSAVASTSPSSTAASGCGSEATTTVAFPPTIAGARRETSPSSAGSSGARIPTTPVGSGMVKLKYGPATGFVPPITCASLSAQPAYQTRRSTDRSTSASPEQSCARSERRASSISAMR